MPAKHSKSDGVCDYRKMLLSIAALEGCDVNDMEFDICLGRDFDIDKVRDELAVLSKEFPGAKFNITQEKE